MASYSFINKGKNNQQIVRGDQPNKYWRKDEELPSGSDEKVKYDASDPTAGYISDKFVAGTGISLTEGTGGNEHKLQITSTITQYTDELAQDAVGNAVGNGLDYDDTTGAISVDETELDHNALGSKQGGTTGEYYHLTAAQHGQLHAPVTVVDSSEIDFTLTGQQISASIVAGSIDETKLDASVNASLDLADTALQAEADTLDSVTSRGNTTNNDITIDQVTLNTIQARTSAGGAIKSNSGTAVAEFGAGGGAGATFYGGVNIDGQTSIDESSSFLSGGILYHDGSRLTTSSILLYNISSQRFGINSSTPDGRLHIKGGALVAGLVIERGGGGQLSQNGIVFHDQVGSLKGAIGTEGAATNDLQIGATGGIRIYSGSNLTTPTNERIRILSGGETLVNTTSTLTSTVGIVALSASTKGQVIRLAHSQTANGLEIQNSSGTSLFNINSGGLITNRLTTKQQQWEYDGSNYANITVSSTGGVTFDAVGSGAGFAFSDPVTVNGQLNTQNVYPITDDTYYLGKNDDDSPLAYKGIILKDQTTGTYYRLEINSGALSIVDLTD